MDLGHLIPVKPRDVWPNEAKDFTPWLLGNGERLAEALGIELELTAIEHPVGGYSLDVIGRDLTNDAVLMVENQLEGTDHTHLGQVLTYAAGTGAATIVWIATSFRDEHRQALDWLNEMTGEEVHFFGVQVGVVRIGDSSPAPLFEVVAKPNDWQKRVRSITRAGTTTERGEKYRSFWTLYLDRLNETRPSWGHRSTPQPANWMGFVGPFRGTQLIPSFAAGKRLRHELYIDCGDGDLNTAVFNALLARRQQIEATYGSELDFDAMEGKRACRIADYRPESVIDREHEWSDYLDWMFAAGDRLRNSLAGLDPVIELEVDAQPLSDNLTEPTVHADLPSA